MVSTILLQSCNHLLLHHAHDLSAHLRVLHQAMAPYVKHFWNTRTVKLKVGPQSSHACRKFLQEHPVASCKCCRLWQFALVKHNRFELLSHWENVTVVFTELWFFCVLVKCSHCMLELPWLVCAALTSQQPVLAVPVNACVHLRLLQTLMLQQVCSVNGSAVLTAVAGNVWYCHAFTCAA